MTDTDKIKVIEQILIDSMDDNDADYLRGIRDAIYSVVCLGVVNDG